jgi:hypothetical protein
MRCSKCGAENPDGAKFCIECASAFVLNRQQLADVARAIDRLPAPDLVPTLKRLFEEDLARWRSARREFAAARARGMPVPSDLHTSYRLQYRSAFAAIGDHQVVELMKAYLPDIDFGFDAACVLKSIWDRMQTSPKDTRPSHAGPPVAVPELPKRLPGTNRTPALL